MALSIGAAVAVRTFGSKRGVVIAVDRDGRYQVRIAAVTMWCSEEDLSVPQEPRKKKTRGDDRPRRHMPLGPRRARLRGGVPDTEEKDSAAPPGHIDLHGLVVEEALARVVDEIDRSLLRGADRVEVVHGKGSGRIRDALHRHLASMPGLTFRLDPRNPGVTWVHFR